MVMCFVQQLLGLQESEPIHCAGGVVYVSVMKYPVEESDLGEEGGVSAELLLWGLSRWLYSSFGGSLQ